MTHFENVEIVMIFYISTKNLKQLCIMYVPVFIKVLTKVEKKKPTVYITLFTIPLL